MIGRAARRAAVAAAGLIALGAAPAHAFEVKVPTAAPADVKAGHHSDVKLRIELSGGQVRDVDIHFPPGLVGDPNATPRCTRAQFEGDGCPPETKVGSSVTEATLLGLPQTLSGEIFNIEPKGEEPARLGIVTDTPSGPLRLESPVFSRPSDGGLDSQIRDIPNSFSGFPITITALETTLLGQAGTGKPFMQNPTACGPKQTVVDARSYADERASGNASFDSTNCLDLPFDPSFTARGGAPGENVPPGANPPLTTVVGQVPGEANVKAVAVNLPADFAVGADRLGRACLQADFDAGRCAPTARIGDATAVTPLLTAPLSGAVTFVAGSNPLPDLILTLTGPLSIQLRGTNEFVPGGQKTTFSGIPDVPLSRFELSFYGGDRGLLAASRNLCEGLPPQLTATFTSHAGHEKTKVVAATIEGCRPGDTPPSITPPKPRPKASVSVRGLRKGTPSLRVRVTAATGNRLRRVRVNLPKGMKLHPRTRLRGAKARSKRRAIEVPARSGGTRTISLTLRSGTLTVTRKLRRAKRLRFTVVATETGGRRTRRAVSVRPRR
ncbi:MAG TPA: hypothetical protein VF529_07085 [Solirubrobacteraceae bacterium]